MSPLPATMRDRWATRAEAQSGYGTIYWHMLLSTYPQVRQLASDAQRVLSDFNGFHMTPPEWLHMTTLVVGSADDVSRDQMVHMVDEASAQLRYIDPIRVKVGKFLYHPEAVMLRVRPAENLSPILAAARFATRAVIGHEGNVGGSASIWVPHVTIAYSTAEQSAGPVISTLGNGGPEQDLVIDSLNLVVQWGPERSWDWERIGSARLGI